MTTLSKLWPRPPKFFHPPGNQNTQDLIFRKNTIKGHWIRVISTCINNLVQYFLLLSRTMTCTPLLSPGEPCPIFEPLSGFCFSRNPSWQACVLPVSSVGILCTPSPLSGDTYQVILGSPDVSWFLIPIVESHFLKMKQNKTKCSINWCTSHTSLLTILKFCLGICILKSSSLLFSSWQHLGLQIFLVSLMQNNSIFRHIRYISVFGKTRLSKQYPPPPGCHLYSA